MRLRRGGAADAPAAAALLARCLAEAWTAEGVARAAAERGGRLLLLEDGQGLAGALLLRAEGGEAEVLQVGVAPERRRAGLGRRLLRAGEAAALEAGASRVVLEVRESNESAKALYLAAGYAEVGRRPGYYRDGEDALVLARDLGPGPPPASC